MYSIDTNILIESWQRLYPIDIFPGVWRNFAELIDKNKIIASEEVRTDLKKKAPDAVSEWAQQHQKMFVPIDTEIQKVVSQILAQYKELLKNTRGRSASDPFVIALAKIRDVKVVTLEHLSGSTKKPKIPDVCEGIGIEWINLIGLFREQGWTFN